MNFYRYGSTVAAGNEFCELKRPGMFFGSVYLDLDSEVDLFFWTDPIISL